MIQTPKGIEVYIGPDIIIVGNFNTPLSFLKRSFKLKTSKEVLELKYTINQLDLTVYRIFYPKDREYTIFLTAHGTFSNPDHTIGHKGSFHKYKKY